MRSALAGSKRHPRTVSTNNFTTSAVDTPVVDSLFNQWTITGTAQLAFNGVIIGATSGVTTIAYVNGVVWQMNNVNNWYSMGVSAGAPVTLSGPQATTPIETITGITLSNASFTGGAATGTVVGAITVQTTGPAFSGTLSLSGTNASIFAISGGNLVTSGTVAAGSYSINIIATQSTAVGSPFTRSAVAITGSSAASNLLPNSLFVNAIAGTPGTLPTDCYVGAGAGLTVNVVGTGTDGTTGTTYLDLQINGTGTGTNIAIFFSSSGSTLTLPVTGSTQYTGSLYPARTVGANPASATYGILLNEYTGLTYGTTITGPGITLTTTPTRATYSPTLGAYDGIQFAFNISYTANTVFSNITYRIAGIQFELGGTATAWQGTQVTGGGGGGTGTWPNNPPLQATNAGFTNLVFFDDFLTDTISQSQTTYNAANKWYASRVSQTSPTNYQMLTTTHAAAAASNALFTGATSAGANASPDGGVWQIKGISNITNNGNFQTIPQGSLGGSYTGAGTWKHFYLEAYIQYNSSGSSTQGSPAGPAFWTLSPNYTVGTEWDCMEVFGGSVFMGTGHTPGGGADDAGTPLRQGSQYRTSEWQTIGFLWESTGTGIGQASLYINDVLIGTHNTGTSTSTFNLENDVLFIITGTGLNFPVYYDWIKLWQ